ncbi:MAG: DUF1842 domain-containing protein [Aliidongia sp.]
MVSIPNPYDRKGIFEIGTGALGAPHLTISLIAISKEYFAQGYGTFSQAVSPPEHFVTKVAGTFRDLPGGAQVYVLHGEAASGLLGASFVTRAEIVLDKPFGNAGVAHYEVFDDTPEPRILKDQPVKVRWLP